MGTAGGAQVQSQSHCNGCRGQLWQALPEHFVIFFFFFFFYKTLFTIPTKRASSLHKATAGPGWLWGARLRDATAGQSHLRQPSTLWSISLSSEPG